MRFEALLVQIKKKKKDGSLFPSVWLQIFHSKFTLLGWGKLLGWLEPRASPLKIILCTF